MNMKTRNVEATIPMGIAAGVFASLIATIVSAIIGAIAVDKQILAEDSIGYFAVAILILSAGVGARTAMRKLKRKKMQMCVITGLCYYAVLLAMTGLFFGGHYESMGITAFSVLLGVGLVALLGSRGAKASFGHHKKSSLVKLYKKQGV